MLLLRSIFFMFLQPGTVTILIPYWLISSRNSSSISIPSALRYFGLVLIFLGASGLLWCVWEFFSRGRGTISPIDPPKHLVVRGLYKYVRNPMYVLAVTTLFGEAIYFASWPVLVEAGVFVVLADLFVRFYEEPTLKRQFGEAYEQYLRSVGRWIPRYRTVAN